MKLKNKKTGEIVERVDITIREEGVVFNNDETYNSLAELNEEWEDYEEPKKHYEILAMGAVMEREDADDEIFRNQGQREIGNYFDTREEAEKAVEKLKSWKRLEDKGFRFDKVSGCWIEFTLPSATSDEDYEQGQKDLHLLFGGEE